MFKSSKKLSDPPKVMTMQEIQEDLETFCKLVHKPNNRDQLIDDIKNLKPEDTLTLSQWWDCFEVKDTQMEEMTLLREKLMEIKTSLLENEISELTQQKSALISEIEDNLRSLNEHKTPK